VVIDRVERFGRRDRLVPGSNIVIKGQPQPEEEEDEETYPADTPTLSVDEETFNPPLLFPPMPMSVIDELRNKYSPHRTRHDWEYLEKKRQEDEREEARKGLGKTMRTPLQELAELRARQKESQKRELTDEQLAQIGAIMAQEMARVSLSTKTPVISTSTESVEQIDKSV
jgi:large subunit ribosomal protein L24